MRLRVWNITSKQFRTVFAFFAIAILTGKIYACPKISFVKEPISSSVGSFSPENEAMLRRLYTQACGLGLQIKDPVSNQEKKEVIVYAVEAAPNQDLYAESIANVDTPIIFIHYRPSDSTISKRIYLKSLFAHGLGHLYSYTAIKKIKSPLNLGFDPYHLKAWNMMFWSRQLRPKNFIKVDGTNRYPNLEKAFANYYRLYKKNEELVLNCSGLIPTPKNFDADHCDQAIQDSNEAVKHALSQFCDNFNLLNSNHFTNLTPSHFRFATFMISAMDEMFADAFAVALTKDLTINVKPGQQSYSPLNFGADDGGYLFRNYSSAELAFQPFLSAQLQFRYDQYDHHYGFFPILGDIGNYLQKNKFQMTALPKLIELVSRAVFMRLDQSIYIQFEKQAVLNSIHSDVRKSLQ